MKQIIQNLNSGETSLIDVPAPMVMEGHLLIQSVCSLVSSGTERMLIDFGRANWLNKARQQPERVKMVLDKIKTDGWGPTIEAVKNKINKPVPLGYSNSGIVLAVGSGVYGFKVGDRVASNGAHAELVQVPQNLAAKIPDVVSYESAACTVVAAIALQGIRLIQPTFGETVVVIGLGLIGQIAIQLLQANGCTVIGIDTDEQKCIQARAFGITAICSKQDADISSSIFAHTYDNGADAVLITASAKDDSILKDAAQMSRKRGRIVLIGVIDLNMNRADFYDKELTFQVSCSYGPGRYDFDFEKNGHDYPIGFVRWTAKRNFEAVLQAMAIGQLKVEPLISNRIAIEDYAKVYNALGSPENKAALFSYQQGIRHSSSISVKAVAKKESRGIALIGAGNFTSKVILPNLQKNDAKVHLIASANGLNAAQLARQFSIATATTDLGEIWDDSSIDTVVVATQHNTHANLCIKALESGKNVFVEKPLAINLAELNDIKDVYQRGQQIVDVGFNRRHAPFAQKMKQLLGSSDVLKNIVITVNVGKIPENNWLNDTALSGGRIIGEVCHFIDLASFFTDSTVHSVCTNNSGQSEEDVTVLLRFANGSAATINYFSNGSKAYDKERVELYSQGKTLILENWKRLTGYGFKGFSSSSVSQDKGHERQFKLLSGRIKNGGAALIPFDNIYNTTAAAIAALQSLREQKWITL
jgi:predicted dehydrogenase/threonine dehydrogenase-like Zn-dependent dehydrogenase